MLVVFVSCNAFLSIYFVLSLAKLVVSCDLIINNFVRSYLSLSFKLCQIRQVINLVVVLLIDVHLFLKSYMHSSNMVICMMGKRLELRIMLADVNLSLDGSIDRFKTRLCLSLLNELQRVHHFF